MLQAAPQVRGHFHVAEFVNRLFLRAGADPELTVRLSLGREVKLDLRARPQACACYCGHYDDGYIEILVACMPAGGVAVDVGANIGLYAVPLALTAKASGGRVICFEPSKPNFQRLVENLSISRVEDVTDCRNVGLSDAAGEARLSLREDFADGACVGNASIVIDDGRDDHFESEVIRLERLDDIFPSLSVDRLDVVKVDIEGHEDLFFAGACATIGRFRPIILTEVNNRIADRRGADGKSAASRRLPSGYRYFRVLFKRLPLSAASKLCGVEEIASMEESGEFGNLFLVPDELVPTFRAAAAGAVAHRTR
jgi:FkbM family methyltransferase